jgi:hypothetical protein
MLTRQFVPEIKITGYSWTSKIFFLYLRCDKSFPGELPEHGKQIKALLKKVPGVVPTAISWVSQTPGRVNKMSDIKVPNMHSLIQGKPYISDDRGKGKVAPNFLCPGNLPNILIGKLQINLRTHAHVACPSP